MSTRDRILDAAWRITSEQGWSAITMSRLGDGAGVSRQSVYNEFGSKQQVAEALIARELQRFLAAVDAGLAAGATPGESVQRGGEAVLRLAADNPMLKATLSAAAGSPSPLLPLLTSQSLPLIQTATARVETGLLAAHPQVAGPHLGSAVDAIVRVVLSHVVQPGPPLDLRWLGDRLLG